MDRNICEDGSLTDDIKEDKCTYSYYEKKDAANIGPVTAMGHLNSAISSWIDELKLNITYDDEGENFTGFIINGKARMPYLKEVNDFNGNNGYLYEYLSKGHWSGQPINKIYSIYGYWTMSTVGNFSTNAWGVYNDGSVIYDYLLYRDLFGVRPVITLGIN